MDLHKGAKTCDLRAFRHFLSDSDDHTYFFTNGDLWDSIYFTDPRFRPSSHEHTDEDDAIDTEVKEMANLLSPIKDRLIAIGTGNHEDVITKKHHTNPSKRLAEVLGVPYMGWSWWFRLALRSEGGRGRSVDFFVSHGFGGGTRTEGGSITKYARFADRFACDVFIVGHDHRKQYVKYPTLGLQGEAKINLVSKSKLVILGGSWKKTYSSTTDPSWEESKGFPPNEIGGTTIEIKVTDPWVKLSVSM